MSFYKPLKICEPSLACVLFKILTYLGLWAEGHWTQMCYQFCVFKTLVHGLYFISFLMLRDKL